MKVLLFLLFIFYSCHLLAQTDGGAILAQQYSQSGNYEKALPIYEKLYNENHAYYEPYFDVLLNLKKFNEAEKLLKKLLKSNPDNFIYKIDHGRLLQGQGEQEKASKLYASILENLPKDEMLIRNIATLFYRAEAFDLAVKTFQRGRNILKDESLFSYDLISLYRFQKNNEMLVQEYLTALINNPQLLIQAESSFSDLFEKPEEYDVLKRSVLTKLQQFPQNVSLTELLSWVYIQQKEYDLALKQVLALDKRLKENGQRVYEFSWTLISNKAYTTAVDGLNYVIKKGTKNDFFIPAKIQLLNIKNKLLIEGNIKPNELVQLEKEYTEVIKEFGHSANTAFAIRQLANLKAFYLNRAKEAEGLLEGLLNTSGLQQTIIGQTKLELGDVYILTGEVWEANLIYGQVEKQFANQPLGHEAKFRNAKLSYYQGDFNWAKAQLDVLKSSTSQLIANDALNLSLIISENTASPPADTNALKDYAIADLLIFKNELDKAIAVLDSITAKYPGNILSDDILMAKARILIKRNSYEKAAELLRQLVSDFPEDIWADDAAFMLAEIYENQLKLSDKALAFFQKVITDYPSSPLINEARNRFRIIRGDKLN